MQQSEVKMFSDEIARLEAEADEAQKIILGQTERLRTLEQRISALKSVVAGTQTRLSVMAHPAGGEPHLPLDVARPASTTAEETLRSERSVIGTTLYGLQRAYVPDSTDVSTYRALASPFAFPGAPSRPAGTEAGTSSRGSLADRPETESSTEAHDDSGVIDARPEGRPTRSAAVDDKHKIDQRL